MKKTIQLILAFIAGTTITVIVCWFAVVRPAGQGSTLLYSSAVADKATTALRLHQGQHKAVLHDIEASLPDFVRAVDSFGRNAQTLPALRKVKEFYDKSGKSIPPEIAGILSSL